MEIGAWTAAVVAAKWLLYAAVAVAIGAPSTAWLLGNRAGAEWQRRTLGHALGACALGAIATALHFLMLLGDFARNGLAGLLDAALARLLWDSPIGEGVMLRIAGFGAIALALLVAGRSAAPPRERFRARAGVGLWLVGAGLLGASFGNVGHAAERGWPANVLVPVHVLAMAWWLGSLHPLARACRSVAAPALREAMARFGRVASAPVALLVLCGVLLVVLLVDSPDALTGSAWGLALCGKLLAVAGMLLLAASHRWRLVPRLADARGAARLRRSIGAESLLAAVVLALTALLSTAFGPAGM